MSQLNQIGCVQMCQSVMFSRMVLVGQIDHVCYKGMMGSGTTALLWAHLCGSHNLSWRLRWVSNTTEMNGPPSWILGAAFESLLCQHSQFIFVLPFSKSFIYFLFSPTSSRRQPFCSASSNVLLQGFIQRPPACPAALPLLNAQR